jgi:sugar transferase EpsL
MIPFNTKRMACDSEFINAYQQFVKYPLDRIAALILLFILSPILLIIGVLIYCRLGSPVLFIQPRPGFMAKTFNLIKFRTMSSSTDTNGIVLTDAERLSPFGAVLRRTSLDELPSLINILRGEMSFVGPRPLLLDYLETYSSAELQRHNVLPGLTGLAQIAGRNQLGLKQKVTIDLSYIRKQSFFLDLRILMHTVVIVLRQQGAVSPLS